MGSSLAPGENSAATRSINYRASQQTSGIQTSVVLSSKSSEKEEEISIGENEDEISIGEKEDEISIGEKEDEISIVAASETIDVSSSIMTKSIPSSLIHDRKIAFGP